MTAAVLQGAPAATFDVDLWIDLPSRQYMRAMNVALKLGAQMVANTVAVLPGDVTINFVYSVTGLNRFPTEYRNATRLEWMGRRVAVLPLERIHRSKSVVGRPKDLAHLPLLEQAMKLQSRLRRRKGGQQIGQSRNRNAGKVVRRGKLKVWTSPVPSTPIEEAVEKVRHYER